MLGLIDTCIVYTDHATTGAYTVVANAALRCRLAHVGYRPAATAADRAELAAVRNLIWDPAYEMPETAQVDVGGVRYNPVAGTFGAFRGPSGAMTYRRADVVRAV